MNSLLGRPWNNQPSTPISIGALPIDYEYLKELIDLDQFWGVFKL